MILKNLTIWRKSLFEDDNRIFYYNRRKLKKIIKKSKIYHNGYYIESYFEPTHFTYMKMNLIDIQIKLSIPFIFKMEYINL